MSIGIGLRSNEFYRRRAPASTPTHAAGFEVRWLTSGAAALEQDASRFALVILDPMLPGAPGLDVLRAMRT